MKFSSDEINNMFAIGEFSLGLFQFLEVIITHFEISPKVTIHFEQVRLPNLTTFLFAASKMRFSLHPNVRARYRTRRTQRTRRFLNMNDSFDDKIEDENKTRETTNCKKKTTITSKECRLARRINEIRSLA